MNTNTLLSNMTKQFLGACAGMAIAGVIYVGLSQTSNMQGLLVSTDTVPDSAGEISINDKNVDEATLRRITTRAATVAKQLNNASSAQPETPLTQHAVERGAKRQFANQVQAQFASAPTYNTDPNHVMTEEERNAIRAARIQPQFTVTAPEKVVPLTFSNPSETETTAAAVTVPQGDDGLHSGAPVAQMQSDNLPSSGLGLNVLVLATLAITFVSANTRWRTQATSLIRSIRLV